jgi:hypothetical protein
MTATTNPTVQFPVCGPRRPVYDALKQRQFRQSTWSDKAWTRLDGLAAHVYGAGSRLLLHRGGERLADGPMAEVLALIDQMTDELTRKENQ